MVPALTTDDFMSQKTFSQSELGRMFTIDKSGYKIDGENNNNHLFTLFGKFSDEDCESVRSDAMEHIECGSHVYEQVCAEFFSVRGITFNEWALTACNRYYYGDKLLLYALCRIFHRHVFVVCYD